SPSDAEVPAFEREFLMEEFIDGPEFSVEALSRDGRHRTFGVVSKGLFEGVAGANAQVELSHHFPASISPAQSEEIQAFVAEFLNIIGITDGPTHTELKWSSRGLRIIETHTRLGGDFIQELIRRTTGVDLIKSAVELSLGLPSRGFDAGHEVHGGAAIRYFSPRPGTVKSVVGVEQWQGHPGVVRIDLPLKACEVVQAVQSSTDRGYVLPFAESGAHALALRERARSADPDWLNRLRMPAGARSQLLTRPAMLTIN